MNYTINLTTTAVSANGRLEKHHTCEGVNESPFFSWEGVPNNTVSLILIMEDPNSDALGLIDSVIARTLWTHWVIYSIPPDVTELVSGQESGDTLENGGIQGTNDYGTVRYSGPCPMPTLKFAAPHMLPTGNRAIKKPVISEERPYFIRLYALDGEMDLPPTSNRDALFQAADGHILAAGEMVIPYKSRIIRPCANANINACYDKFWSKSVLLDE